MGQLKINDIKVYCKFDNNKESIDKVICKIFEDYSQNKNIELKSRQKENNTLVLNSKYFYGKEWNV